MPDHQTIFDTVARHLLTQNAKSWLAPDSCLCAYRSPEGLKCAVGCLITDAEYRTTANEIEGQSVDTVVACIPRLKPFQTLLQDLQDVHDNSDPNRWLSHLNDVAAKHGLREYHG